MIKSFWSWVETMVHNIVNVLNAIELFIFKVFSLCYANFTSIKKKWSPADGMLGRTR